MRKIQVVRRNLNGITATAYSFKREETVYTRLGEVEICVSPTWEVTIKRFII